MKKQIRAKTKPNIAPFLLGITPVEIPRTIGRTQNKLMPYPVQPIERKINAVIQKIMARIQVIMKLFLLLIMNYNLIFISKVPFHMGKTLNNSFLIRRRFDSLTPDQGLVGNIFSCDGLVWIQLVKSVYEYISHLINVLIQFL